ncbi:MAG: sigma-70 family RNA polymerase sigma factor [Firmicutes bacterium]|nr:sigma-70 family RNA polymerase sigma factor [Bacillota bacterium]
MRETDTFEQIYSENYEGIYGFIFKMCNDSDLCDELTQECFFQAFISLHRYNGSCEIFTWLAAIAKNVYFKYLRKHSRCPVAYELLADELEYSGDSPEALAEREDLCGKVREIIMGLRPNYRDVILLRVYGELPFSQIAEALKITENSAKVIFFRAKNAIREEIENENIL